MKAYKLERILRLMCAEPGVTVAALRTAPPALRERVADAAKCRVPSDRTWQMACDMTEGKATR